MASAPWKGWFSAEDEKGEKDKDKEKDKEKEREKEKETIVYRSLAGRNTGDRSSSFIASTPALATRRPLQPQQQVLHSQHSAPTPQSSTNEKEEKEEKERAEKDGEEGEKKESQDPAMRYSATIADIQIEALNIRESTEMKEREEEKEKEKGGVRKRPVDWSVKTLGKKKNHLSERPALAGSRSMGGQMKRNLTLEKELEGVRERKRTNITSSTGKKQQIGGKESMKETEEEQQDQEQQDDQEQDQQQQDEQEQFEQRTQHLGVVLVSPHHEEQSAELLLPGEVSFLTCYSSYTNCSLGSTADGVLKVTNYRLLFCTIEEELDYSPYRTLSPFPVTAHPSLTSITPSSRVTPSSHFATTPDLEPLNSSDKDNEREKEGERERKKE